MAILPQYSSQTSAGIGSSPRASSASFGGGEGLQAIGRAVGGLQQVYDTVLRQKAERDATAYVAEQSSALQLNGLKQFEAMRTDGEPIDTFSDRFNAYYEEQAKIAIDNAPNNLAKEAMKEHSISIGTSLNRTAITFQAEEKVGQLKQSSINALNNIANSILINPGNFNEFKSQWDSQSASAARYMTPSELEQFKRNGDSVISSSFIRAKIESNPYEAEKLLKTQEFRDSLTNNDFMSLYNAAGNAIDRLEVKREKEQVMQQGLGMVSQAIEGNVVLDPHSSETQKYVDLYFEDFQNRISDMPQDVQVQVQRELVSKIGVYPKQMKSRISAQLNNGNQEQKIQAAELIDSISMANPATTTQIPDSERIRAKAIVDNINAGLDPKLAISLVEQNIFNKDTPEYKARAERFSDPKNGEEIKFNPSDFTGWGSPDTIPDAMRAQYDTMNRTFFMSGQLDAKQASSLAKEKLAAQWRETNIDGHKRWMQYAPEAMYGNQAGTDWIAQQLKDDIEKIPSQKGAKHDLFLSVVPSTIRQPDPSYLIFNRDENGILKPLLMDNGKQAVFKPDFSSSSEYTRLLHEFNGDKVSAMNAARIRRNNNIVKQDILNKMYGAPR